MKPQNFRRHPLNKHLGRARIAEGVSKQKSHPLMISMRFFVWWSFIFLMHHIPIKAIAYVTDVIEIS